MRSFEDRVLSPVVINRELTFYGTWGGTKEIVLWVQDETGVVGMKWKVWL